jgi:hypothetical protein
MTTEEQLVDSSVWSSEQAANSIQSMSSGAGGAGWVSLSQHLGTG